MGRRYIGVTCSIPTCGISKKMHPYMRFHSSPKNRKKQLEWIEALGEYSRQAITDFKIKRSFPICNSHFEPDCVAPNGRLKPSAIPRLNLVGRNEARDSTTIPNPNIRIVEFVTVDIKPLIFINEQSHTQESTAEQVMVKQELGEESEYVNFVPVESAMGTTGESEHEDDPLNDPLAMVETVIKKEPELTPDEDVLLCLKCNQRFPEWKKRLMHSRLIHREDLHPCRECDNQFGLTSSSSTINGYSSFALLNQLDEIPVVVCPMCGIVVSPAPGTEAGPGRSGRFSPRVLQRRSRNNFLGAI